MRDIIEIPVVCAVIRSGECYLAVQRSVHMSEALRWEFPGGKIEAGETLIDALHREIGEELATSVSVRGILRPSIWKKNQKKIILHPILCTLLQPSFHLHEHSAFRWLTRTQLREPEWCDADLEILDHLENRQIEATAWWYQPV